MNIFFNYNDIHIGKTLSSYYLAKYFHNQKRKILIVNFDQNSIYKKLVTKWKKFYIDSSIGLKTFNTYLMKFDFFDCINIFNNSDSKMSKNDLKIFWDKFIDFFKDKYQILIFDGSCCLADQFSCIMNFCNYVVVPYDINNFDYKMIWNKIFPLINKENMKLFFYVVNFDFKKENNILNFIKLKKAIGFVLLQNYIKYYEFLDSTLYFSKKEIESDYYNIFSEFKILY